MPRSAAPTPRRRRPRNVGPLRTEKSSAHVATLLSDPDRFTHPMLRAPHRRQTPAVGGLEQRSGCQHPAGTPPCRRSAGQWVSSEATSKRRRIDANGSGSPSQQGDVRLTGAWRAAGSEGLRGGSRAPRRLTVAGFAWRAALDLSIARESRMSLDVIIPTLGHRLGWLEQCLRSIRGQAVEGIRVIVVAPEEAPVASVVARYGGELLNSPASGLSGALNAGFQTVRDDADFVTWLGDDDLLAPGCLQATTEALRAKPA